MRSQPKIRTCLPLSICMILAFLLGTIPFLGSCAVTKAERIKQKLSFAQKGAILLESRGRDISGLIRKMGSAYRALQNNDVDSAEYLLDLSQRQILQSCGRGAVERVGTTPLPRAGVTEPETDAFSKPVPVRLRGYHGDAMEPLISRDGKTLFFNNSNSPEVKTRIHFARRLDALTFDYAGVVPGTDSGKKDMAPAMDGKGRIYFTSLRSYEKTLRSIFTGVFSGKAVADVVPVRGSISSTVPGLLNMDCEVSCDGDTMVLSRAWFTSGRHVPTASNLVLACRKKGAFLVEPNSKAIMKRVTTAALEYAPCLSSDKLVLYFTRASELMTGSGKGAEVRILVAKRKNATAPFGPPHRIKSINGFVEGPTLSMDGRELFFHKRENGRFLIQRAIRKNP